MAVCQRPAPEYIPVNLFFRVTDANGSCPCSQRGMCRHSNETHTQSRSNDLSQVTDQPQLQFTAIKPAKSRSGAARKQKRFSPGPPTHLIPIFQLPAPAYRGGAVVAGAVSDGGGVVASGEGVIASGFAELFGDFVLLLLLLVRD